MPATVKIIISAAAFLVGTAACATPAPGPRIAPETPATVTAATPVTTSRPGSVTPLGEFSGDIHEIDWRRSRLPGDFCDIPELVAFEDGEATAVSNSWGAVHLSVMSTPDDTVYGDVDGDGGDEALIHLECDNGGGTASGQLAFGYVVVRESGGALGALGSIVPKLTPQESSHVTLLGDVEIKAGQITVEELWYRTSDPTCCPSGVALTTWRWESDRLTAGAPVQVS